MPPPAEAHARLRLRRALRWAGFGFLLFFLAPYYLVNLYIFADPPVSAYMLRHAGRGIHYRWRSLDQISPLLVTQVIAAEDGRFCEHWGVDFDALDAAADAFAEGHAKGGGSTVTMQTAKNLFLWNKPSFLRKPFENSAGHVYGSRARQAARDGNLPEHRRMGAGRLRRGSRRTAPFRRFRLGINRAAGRPARRRAANPKRRNAGKPGPRVFALARRLKARAAAQRAGAACVLGKGEDADGSSGG